MKHMFVQPLRAVAVAATVAAATLLGACGPSTPALTWQPLVLDAADLELALPCDAQTARNALNFGLGDGPVTVYMVGCDAEGSTFAVSHYVLDDVTQTNDALGLWQAAVLSKLKPVEGGGHKSREPFVPEGALPLPQSIRATVEGEGAAGWTITTHGVWFARQEGERARIYHAVVYAPKASHATADAFFDQLALRPLTAQD